MGAMFAHDVIGNTGERVTSEASTRIAIDGMAPIVFIIDGDVAVRQSIEW